MRNFIWASITLLAALFFNGQTAVATSLGVEPLFIEIEPTKSSSLKVLNRGDREIPVEIIIYERIVDEQGNQTKLEADDDFIIFPPQAVIPASSVQNIRFQPINAEVSQSKSYYITVKQIPVDLGDRPDGMYINVVLAFDAAVHIVPKRAKAEAVALSAKPSTMSLDDGVTTVSAIEFELENIGNKYLYLQDYDFEVTGQDQSGNAVKLNHWTREEIIQTVPVILLPPGQKRHFKLPIETDLTGSSLSVTISPR